MLRGDYCFSLAGSEIVMLLVAMNPRSAVSFVSSLPAESCVVGSATDLRESETEKAMVSIVFRSVVYKPFLCPWGNQWVS